MLKRFKKVDKTRRKEALSNYLSTRMTIFNKKVSEYCNGLLIPQTQEYLKKCQKYDVDYISYIASETKKIQKVIFAVYVSKKKYEDEDGFLPTTLEPHLAFIPTITEFLAFMETSSLM